MIEEPSYSTSHTNTKQYKWPIGPRAYVDDHGLLSIGDNWETNNEHLARAAKRLTDLLCEIGLKINPRKSEIMHFSIRRNEKAPPPGVLNIYGTRTELMPPKEGYLRWLGAFLDKKLSWKLHTKVMNKRGTTILSGMKCLGNTIWGLTQQNRRTLYLSCILPVLTYAAPVWFRPDKRQEHLLDPLMKIQSEALRWMLGVFRTTPLPALNILAHVPPIQEYISKLTQGYALRLFRLPLLSPITGRIPSAYIPHTVRAKGKATHIPFARPHKYQPQFKPSKVTNLQRLSGYMEPTTERTYPFANHNAPWAADLLTPPYMGRITIKSDPPPKEEQKSLASNHNIIWNQAKSSKRTLIVYSDGSKNLTGNKQTTGYGLISMCQGKQVFTISVKHSHKSSLFDAEMYAIAHASWGVLLYLDRNPTITKVKYYSDCSSALKSIMDGGPHAAQFASILFRIKTHKLLTKYPNVKVCGHQATGGSSDNP